MINSQSPRLIFWEITNRCNLNCIHCRANTSATASPDELSLEQMKGFIDSVGSFGKPIIVLTGGEPLYRADVFDLAKYIAGKGMRAALATNGTLIDKKIAREIHDAGIMRVSVSIDGASPDIHDTFRQQKGSFDKAVRGAKYLLEEGVDVQINTSVTTHNVDNLPAILGLAINLGAKAFHVFLLVPVGCGLEIAKEKEISPARYEEVLGWLYEKELEGRIEIKATCAPHYYRIARQKGSVKHGRGCLAGSGVCFVSHTGQVQPCGYLPIAAGSVLERDFKDIWDNSSLFHEMREPALLKGKCGRCEYKVVCMGCRARAYGETEDYLGEEPYCVYEPKGAAKAAVSLAH